MPRGSLDAREYLPKQAPRQVALSKLEDEVSLGEAPVSLEEPLLQARQGPALNGQGQGEPAQESWSPRLRLIPE